jgi:hypothetical protein
MNTGAKIGLPPFLAAVLPTAVLVLLALAAARRANEGPR